MSYNIKEEHSKENKSSHFHKNADPDYIDQDRATFGFDELHFEQSQDRSQTKDLVAQGELKSIMPLEIDVIHEEASRNSDDAQEEIATPTKQSKNSNHQTPAQQSTSNKILFDIDNDVSERDTSTKKAATEKSNNSKSGLYSLHSQSNKAVQMMDSAESATPEINVDMKSHGGFNELSHWSDDGMSSQHDGPEMLMDKNFLFSKIQKEFKDEHKVINQIRQNLIPRESIKVLNNIVFNRIQIILILLLVGTTVPTIAFLAYKLKNEGLQDQEHIYMFLIMQIGFIISVIQSINLSHTQIDDDLKDNQHAKYMMKTMLMNVELVDLDRKAQADFDEKQRQRQNEADQSSVQYDNYQAEQINFRNLGGNNMSLKESMAHFQNDNQKEEIKKMRANQERQDILLQEQDLLVENILQARDQGWLN